jgi:hypothetical protein
MLGLFNKRHKESRVTDGSLDWLWPAAERAGVAISLAAAMFFANGGEDCGGPPWPEANYRLHGCTAGQ